MPQSQTTTDFVSHDGADGGVIYFLTEVWESCAQLLDALSDQMMKKIVLLKFEGASNGEIADEMKCTRRTIERKLERIRRIWVEAGLHDVE